MARLLEPFQLPFVQRGEHEVAPGGHHHHHAICRGCGRMVPFEDPGLERAIGRVSAQVQFEVTDHDVVLRGLCPRCAG
jgi:Fur family ferric uptake transcriptional regulator